MFRSPPYKDEYGPQGPLRNVDDTYVFDAGSGIYKPKTQNPTEQCGAEKPGSSKRFRFFTNPKRDWVSIIVSIATLVVVGVYTHYARLQWCEMQKAAVAANGANEISSQALHSVQRAYVAFEQIETGEIQTFIPIGTKVWQFTPLWENAGNTPATPAIHDFFAEALNDEPSEKKFIGKERWYSAFQISPHGHMEGRVRNVQESEILKAREGIDNKLMFIAWGWLVYRDVLPNTEPRVTEFCLEMTQIGFKQPIQKVPGFATLPPANQLTVSWTQCKQHNCADRNCEDYEKIAALLPK